MLLEYDKNTGEILGLFAPGTIEADNLIILEDEEIIDKINHFILEYPFKSKYYYVNIETKEIVERPTIYHIWTGTSWIIDIEKAKEDKKNEIATKRWEEETSGILYNDIFIKTDRDSQSAMFNIALIAMQDPTYTCKWKTQDGFITLNASQILEIASMIRAHVQACFDKESLLYEQIDACTTLEELETITW